jgi:hypothetical protein
MKTNKILAYWCVVFLVAAFFLLQSSIAKADMAGGDYQILSDVIGSFGSESSSANFQINDTGGEMGTGAIGGASSEVKAGFWNDLLGASDQDHDGIPDATDNCVSISNTNQRDADHDGVGDACDNCEDDSNADQDDSDDDGVGDECDNCQEDSNSDQDDSDNDGVGDDCDNCPNKSNSDQDDSDGDGVGDVCDNCALRANANQNDGNGNGVGDVCEPPVANDTDGDGILNDNDNCQIIYNPEQQDLDGDGTGDACDADIDGDGVDNADDNCSLQANADQADSNNNGTGDVCDSAAPGGDDFEPPVIPDTGEEPLPVASEVEKEKEKGKNQVISSIGSIIKGLEKNIASASEVGRVFEENGELVDIATSAAATVSLLPIVFQVSSIKDILLVISNSMGGLLGLIFRRRRDWGIVYDVDKNEALPMATVEIYNSSGRFIERRITDKYGAYTFLVTPGKYSLSIIKDGYEMASQEETFRTVYANNYFGGELEVQGPDIINLNIPLRSQKVKETGIIQKSSWDQFRDGLSWLVLKAVSVLFYSGFAVTLVALVISPQKLVNGIILALYVVCGVIRTFSLKQKGWGKVIGEKGAVAPFATIRVFDQATGNFVVRTIADEFGRYLIILRKGKYIMNAFGVKGEKWEGVIEMKKLNTLKKKIVIRQLAGEN